MCVFSVWNISRSAFPTIKFEHERYEITFNFSSVGAQKSFAGVVFRSGFSFNFYLLFYWQFSSWKIQTLFPIVWKTIETQCWRKMKEIFVDSMSEKSDFTVDAIFFFHFFHNSYILNFLFSKFSLLLRMTSR